MIILLIYRIISQKSIKITHFITTKRRAIKDNPFYYFARHEQEQEQEEEQVF